MAIEVACLIITWLNCKILWKLYIIRLSSSGAIERYQEVLFLTVNSESYDKLIARYPMFAIQEAFFPVLRQS